MQFVGAYAVPGVTTATAAGAIDAFLAGFPEQGDTPAFVLVNLGSNDLTGASDGSITEAAWSANFAYILDAVHAKWPSAQVRVALPYWSGLTTGMDRMDGTWIPAILASRSSWAAVGPDERSYLPGNLTDATHPNATGYALTAAEWQTAMGY